MTDLLHWALMGAGILAAWFGVASALWGLARWFATNVESDPDLCRDKALEMAGDAYRMREG